jgi:2-polyprenyl-6-methoxyphenol hydroxylase-like FAD-dependent oxidoreductase
MVQVKVPSLYKGRFVLVGDAGYAPGPTGAGTSLALTGAYVLAGEVGRHKGDLAAGLRGYEERMRPIINDMQRIPPGIPGLFAPQTAWGIQLRNMLFTFVTWGMAFSRVFAWAGKFFASSFGTDKYGIPDYGS